MSSLTSSGPEVKANTLPKRTCCCRNAGGGRWVMTLTQFFPRKAAEDTHHHLTPLASDFGLAYRLQKLQADGGEIYDVYLNGARSSCDCKGEPLTPSGVSLMITRLAKAAGVKLSRKQLREGFCSRHAGKVPAQVLQRLMRHASIGTTLGFYANVSAAVEEAVFGPEHNSSHSSESNPVQEEKASDGASPSTGENFD